MQEAAAAAAAEASSRAEKKGLKKEIPQKPKMLAGTLIQPYVDSHRSV